MSFLKNTVSLFALFSVIPAAYAVTARPSVLNATTARRMPTMSAYITGATGGLALLQSFIIKNKAFNNHFLQNRCRPYSELSGLITIYTIAYGNDCIKIV